ncbi:MAG: ATP-binding protein [Anaerolineae bacterium]
MDGDLQLTPATNQDLQALIQKGRSRSTEWAAAHVSADDIALTLNGMANSAGGMYLIGVEADGLVTGVSNAAEVVDRVIAAALRLDPPLILPIPQVVDLAGKSVVAATIPAGMPRVYAYNGRYMHREDASTAPLSPQSLRQLFIRRGEISFEAEPAPNTTSDDLDWDKVNAYTSQLKGLGESDTKTILIQRGCLIQQGEHLLPTHAGLLLFGKTPQRVLHSAEVMAARFAGDTMSDTFTKQDITGTLPDQLRRVETFLVDHLRKDVRLQQTMKRKEDYEYPLEAARELVVNAVAHRDYSIRGDGIRLFLYKDRMEVISPGKLPGPVTIANIKDERFSRNPIIVQVLSDMGFIEKLGYGVDRVIELMAQQGLRAPEFHETAGGFRVVLYSTAAEQPRRPINPPQENPAVIAEVLKDYEGVQINPRQEAAIAYLREPGHSRITNSELQRLYPDVHAETIRRDLADLVTKNILSKRGQKRGSYYVLKRDDLPETEPDDDEDND